MAEPSSVRFRFSFGQLPFLPGATDYAEQWLFPGGSCNNQRTYEEHIEFNGLEEEMQMLLFTPETSGGLLIALPPAEAGQLLALCRGAGQPVWKVGDVVEGRGIEIVP
jgi:selenide,water dikinase